MTGCVVTREPVYDAPTNLPPSVHGSPESPMYIVEVVDIGSGPASDDAGLNAADPTFVAIVRDANVRDRLEARIFINLDHADDANPITALVRDREPIPAETDEDPGSRRFMFTIPRSRFEIGCNWIELHVSREFEGLPSLLPAGDDPNDVGVGVWFRAGVDGDSIPDMRGCP